MQFAGIECDNCKREERADKATGWLRLATYMTSLRSRADLLKPAPPEFAGTFCTPSCLVEYVDRRSAAMLSETPETIGEFITRKEREHGHDSPFDQDDEGGGHPGRYA